MRATSKSTNISSDYGIFSIFHGFHPSILIDFEIISIIVLRFMLGDLLNQPFRGGQSLPAKSMKKKYLILQRFCSADLLEFSHWLICEQFKLSSQFREESI